MLSRNNLHAYQEKAVDFIKEKRKCALFLDLGLGKTVSTLTFIADGIDSFCVKKVLIIAPLRVANSVWKQEAMNWAHLNHLRVSVATGDMRERAAALKADADIYVTNRENLPWLFDYYGSNIGSNDNRFDTIVIDESSSFKNPSAKRFKALKRFLPYTDHLILLTATPSPNSLHDLWAQMFLIDKGDALGNTITKFRTEHFTQGHSGFGYTIKKGSDVKIQKAIEPLVLSMQASDYLDMPDKLMLYEDVLLPDSAVKVYDDFKDQLFITLHDGEEVEALSAAGVVNKLLQIAAGAVYTDDAGNFTVIHDAKIDALREIVENNDEPILVAYNYKSDLARLRVAFPQAEVLGKDHTTIERWNKGKIRLLLAHPASAGHGLNLQHGGSLMIWFSLNWNLEYYLQFNARLYRQGQTKPVRIIHLVAKNTMDERVVTALKNKNLSQQALLDAVKC